MSATPSASVSPKGMRPPGPQGLRAWLAFFEFARSPLDNLVRSREQWGDCSAFPVATDRVVIVHDPEVIGEVLLDREGRFRKDKVTRELEPLLGTGLLLSEGELWRRQRKLIAPSLQRRHIASYADAMVARTREYGDGLADGQVRDMHADMMQLTLAIVVETLFGGDLGVRYEAIGRAMEDVMTSFQDLVRTWRRFVPKAIPIAARRRMMAAHRTIDAAVLEVIRARREQPTDGDDLLSRLLAARDDEGSQMSDAQLRDEALTMFVAGHETTANALSFALMLLADHPSVADRVRREVASVVGERPATAEDAPKLRFTEAVIKETLRLHPPAYLLGREATESVTIGRWRFERGDQILMSPWALHRDPRWFEAPLEFRPERWMDGLAERLPRNAYFPFGSGPRICIGNHFAMMETVLVLATLLARASFSRASSEAVELMPSITLRPKHGVRLLVSIGAR